MHLATQVLHRTRQASGNSTASSRTNCILLLHCLINCSLLSVCGVGPQGGYNYFGGFAKYLEEMGTGYMQHNSALGNVICTGSHKYLKNFEDLVIDYQTRFNIDYWKWDGFVFPSWARRNRS